MKISIIVPAFNEEKFIARSLRKIKAATDAFSLLGWEGEIIVCDNNSTDRTAEKARAAHATVEVSSGGRSLGVLAPERRMFPAEGQETVQTAIHTTGFSDLYLALGDDRGGGRCTIRAYVNPLAPFIWFGAGIMALGGLASLWGRLRAIFFVKTAVAATETA